MPNILRYTLQISVAVVVIAVIIAIAQRTQVPLQSDATYCYEGIKTQSDRTPWANCFSVSAAGQFTRVFPTPSEDTARSNIEYAKGYVIPGLWDGHGHVLGLGEVLQTAQLYNSRSLHETLARVREYVLGHSNSGSRDDWILGSGWDQAAFGRMPSSSDLESDDVLKDRYIMLYRVDAHCIWVSNAVLNLLPVPIPEVPGGEVIGKGVFCDNAMDIVLKHAPKADQARLISYLKSAMKELNRVGIVGVHEAGVTPSNLKLYNRLADTDTWTVRIYAMLECQTRNAYCPNDAAKINREDGRLMMRSVKLFGGMNHFRSSFSLYLTISRWRFRKLGQCND
jgi:predicted amidohydrolase YtcJ